MSSVAVTKGGATLTRDDGSVVELTTTELWDLAFALQSTANNRNHSRTIAERHLDAHRTLNPIHPPV